MDMQVLLFVVAAMLVVFGIFRADKWRLPNETELARIMETRVVQGKDTRIVLRVSFQNTVREFTYRGFWSMVQVFHLKAGDPLRIGFQRSRFSGRIRVTSVSVFA